MDGALVASVAPRSSVSTCQSVARAYRRRIANLPPLSQTRTRLRDVRRGGSTGGNLPKNNPVGSRERAGPRVDAHRASLDATQRDDAFCRARSSDVRHARARCVAASRRAPREALRSSNPNAFASEWAPRGSLASASLSARDDEDGRRKTEGASRARRRDVSARRGAGARRARAAPRARVCPFRRPRRVVAYAFLEVEENEITFNKCWQTFNT